MVWEGTFQVMYRAIAMYRVAGRGGLIGLDKPPFRPEICTFLSSIISKYNSLHSRESTSLDYAYQISNKIKRH